jgi:hypothetical protein
MHFELTLPDSQLLLFKVAKLREISLTRRLDGLYELAFWLEAENSEALEAMDPELQALNQEVSAELLAAASLIPNYLSIEVAA